MQHVTRLAVAAAAMVSIGAFAQDKGFVATASSTPEDNRPDLISKIGMAADIGGGILKFVDSGLYNISDTGGAWMARLTIGTRSYVGGEVAYVGTANGIRTLAVDDRAVLLSHGVEGLLRINALTGDWQPYGVAGYTYRRFSIQNNASNTSAVSTGDDDSEIPVGIGMAYRFKGLVADSRFMVHPSVFSKLTSSNNGYPLALSFNAKIGFEF